MKIRFSSLNDHTNMLEMAGRTMGIVTMGVRFDFVDDVAAMWVWRFFELRYERSWPLDWLGGRLIRLALQRLSSQVS